MPRRARSILGGYAYHILNRANGRLRLFKKNADFAAFEEVLAQAFERVPLRILGYTLMGNHWHFVVWPKQGQHDQVSEFFRWLAVTHSLRWHVYHGTVGMGHVYQGRFKSFPIETDEHLLTVLREGRGVALGKSLPSNAGNSRRAIAASRFTSAFGTGMVKIRQSTANQRRIGSNPP